MTTETLPAPAPELGNGVWPTWYEAWRGVLRERVEAEGLPSRRQENWKYTPLDKLDAASPLSGSAVLEPEDLGELALPTSRFRVTFVDGRYRPELSTLDGLGRGVEVRALSRADDASLLPFRSILESAFGGADETAAAAAAAGAREGCVIAVEAGTMVDDPIQVAYLWTEAAGSGTAPMHHLIQIGASASLALHEVHVALGEAAGFCNQVTTVLLESEACLRATRAQALGDSATLVTRVDVHQDCSSRYEHSEFDLGGRLVRHDVNCRLEGEGAEAALQGIYALTGARHADNHSRVDHLASDTRSDEYYKGVLDGRSRGVFNGKVVVAEGTAGIEADQINRNLLLSRQAEIDTKPELEIYADDVKCSHGATVGQLDERQLYYLRSRGIPLDQARRMLMDAFCREIVDRVGDEALRTWIGDRLAEALPSQEAGPVNTATGEGS